VARNGYAHASVLDGDAKVTRTGTQGIDLDFPFRVSAWCMDLDEARRLRYQLSRAIGQCERLMDGRPKKVARNR
jgi:hypothetical protein